MGACILILTDAENFSSYGQAQTIRAFGRVTGDASPFASGTDADRESALASRAALFDQENGEWALDDIDQLLAEQAPIAVALLTSENFASLEDLPVILETAVRATPIILFASRRGKFKDRSVLDTLASRIVGKDHQAKAWIDVSTPKDEQVVHHTWPHELPLDERPAAVAEKLSALDGGDAVGGDLLPAEASGILALEIDATWAGEAGKARGFKAPPRRVGRHSEANNDDERRMRASNELLRFLGHDGAKIVVTRSNTAPDRLHAELAFLAEAPNVFWRDRAPGPPLTEVTAALDAKKLAEVERRLGLVADGLQDGSAAVESPEERAKNGLQRLLHGQVASLSQARPIDEKEIDRIAKRAGQNLKSFAAALKAQALESLRYRDAPKAILSHLGTAKDCLRGNDKNPWQEMWRQLRTNLTNPTSTFKLELRMDQGWPIIQRRIYEVAAGIAVAQGELLRLYWLRFEKPYLTEQAERLAENSEDYPVIPVFDAGNKDFINDLAGRIEDTLERPPPVEASSLYSLKPVVTTVRQIIRKSPMYLGLFAGALAVFGWPQGEGVPWMWVIGLFFLVAVFYVIGLRMKNKEEQSAKRDAYMKSVESAVRTKLGEIVAAWSDHIDQQREAFIGDLQEALRIHARNASALGTERSEGVRAGLAQRVAELENRIEKETQEAEARQREVKAAVSRLARIAERMVKDFEKER